MKDQKRDSKFWFWAWLSLITVPKRSVPNETAKGELWQTLTLISSATAARAVARALELGKAQAGDSRGSLTLDGVPAKTVFLGIEDIGLLHDGIEDGAEILFRSSRRNVHWARKRTKTTVELRTKLQRELGPYVRANAATKGRGRGEGGVSL